MSQLFIVIKLYSFAFWAFEPRAIEEHAIKLHPFVVIRAKFNSIRDWLACFFLEFFKPGMNGENCHCKIFYPFERGNNKIHVASVKGYVGLAQPGTSNPRFGRFNLDIATALNSPIISNGECAA